MKPKFFSSNPFAREMKCIKLVGAGLLMMCLSPQFTYAETYAANFSISSQQNKTQVSGVVVDQAGEPLIGVSVLAQGTSVGTITNIDGEFSLSIPKGAMLEISYLGYKKQVVKSQATTMKVVLEEDTQRLDEVVVVGFGTQKKVNLTGAVTAVTGKDISKRPVANASVLLQGQVPGLRVNQNAGQPGEEGTSFRIRGRGTFSDAGSNPLILINGVPGSMSNLDPSMIESISVLKDAASAAIYGARAANGVILVTTKQGSVDDKVTISYHGNIGLHSATRLYDRVTNSVEYMTLANLAWRNSNGGKSYSQDQIDLYRNNVGDPRYPNFDWQDYMFRTAAVQTHNLSIAGNSKKSTYNVALNYVDQPGTMRGFEYKKYNATIDLTAQITDFIKMGTYANLMYGDSSKPRQGQQDSYLSTLSQAPTYRPWLPDDGSGIRRWSSSAYFFEDHNKNIPAILAENVLANNRFFDINAQLWLEVSLAKGLTWHTKGAARLISSKTSDWRGSEVDVFNYHTGERTGILDKGGLGLSVNDGRRFYTNLYTYLKYDFNINDRAHNFALMVGYNQESEKYETLGAYRKTFPFNLPVINAGGNEDWSNSGGEQEWAIQSLFGRFNYNYKERYLFEANMRYDGTSRIAEENRWGVFPSFSFGWRATEEQFIKDMNLSWLDNFKLRASWGQLGNQNIGLYPYQAMINGVNDYPFSKTADGTVVGYHQTVYAQRNLMWETTTITDVGFDLQVLNGLSVTFDWYKKTTDDILRSSQVTDLLGLSAPTINDGSVENTGVELAINYANMVKEGTFKGLRYNAGIYFDRSRNKLTRFGAEEIGSISIKREGLPYGQFYMLENIGVFANQAEIDNSPKQFNDNVQPGDLKYKDINGDNVIDSKDRRTFDGQFPGFEYGINAGLTFKGIDLSLIGQGVADKKYYTNGWGVQPFLQGSAPNRDYVEGMWTEENPNGAVHPRLYYSNMGGGKNTRASSYYLKDASFFRVKNLTLGYTFPRKWTEKAKISKLRVYFSGDNLLTITPYKGLDPERPGNGTDATYPQNKIYSFGLNLEF